MSNPNAKNIKCDCGSGSAHQKFVDTLSVWVCTQCGYIHGVVGKDGMMFLSPRDERQRAKRLIVTIMKGIEATSGKKVKTIESNIIHFIAHDVMKTIPEKERLSCGWFHYGPYYLSIDDALVEMKILKPEYHQMGEHLNRTAIFEKGIEFGDEIARKT
jgi:hypothetical protein